MAELARSAVRASDPSPTSRPEPAAGMTTRERVRARIRSEVARLNPTDDARQALELIAETSLRYAETDGEPKITVVDQHGQPRTTVRDGQVVEFSLRDLVEELRAKHPTLFKGPPSERLGAVTTGIEPVGREEAQAGGPEEAPADEPGGAAAPLPQPRPRPRDWLYLASDHETDSTPPRPEPTALAEPPEPAPSPQPTPQPSRRGARAPAAASPQHSPGWRRSLGRASAALLLIAAGAVGFLLVRAPTERSERTAPTAVSRSGEDASPRPTDPASTGAVPPAPQAPAPAPPPARPAAAPAPTGDSPPAPDGDPAALRGVPEVLDTATLYLGGKIVPLFGVEWARGGGNPEDLAQYLRGREVVCRPAPWSETYRCEVDGQDLSKVVLFNGGGRATAEATPELKAAESQARSARAGLWGK